MTVRYVQYVPNTILYASDVQKNADNGIIEISAIVELSQVGAEVNMVFCKENYELYKRIAEGTGDVGSGVWELFSGSLPDQGVALSHTGTGELTILEYNDRYKYKVVDYASGADIAGVSVVDDKVILNDVYNDGMAVAIVKRLDITDPSKMRLTRFDRRSVTYHQENRPTCSCNCRPITGNCFDGSGTCSGDGNCAADGTICCCGSMGQTCTDNWVTVKDPVPAGFTEKFGEWVQLYNADEVVRSVGTKTVVGGTAIERESIVPFATNHPWVAPYYLAFPLPAPTGTSTEGGPVFPYNFAVLTNRDEQGEVNFMVTNVKDDADQLPDVDNDMFLVTEVVKDSYYELFVQNLPDLVNGTWELELIGDDDSVVESWSGNVG
jgi:hypothetical protein